MKDFVKKMPKTPIFSPAAPPNRVCYIALCLITFSGAEFLDFVFKTFRNCSELTNIP